jgi:hypothetical protein
LEEIRPWSRHHSRQIASGKVIEKSSAAEAILHHLTYKVALNKASLMKAEHHERLKSKPRPRCGRQLVFASGYF